MPSNPAQNCWFLTGPTAAGKSAVGVELARRINAEIVSLDSMTLYRGLDIGTAKPTPRECRSVPHHLIDVLEPHEEYSLAQYVARRDRCVAEIAGRGHEVLFVGGTPLYLKGLLRGIFEGPPADWELRRRLADQAAAERRPMAARTGGPRRSGRGRPIARQRHGPVDPCAGGLRKDRPTDQPVAAAVRRGSARGRMSRVRVGLAQGGVARPDRASRGRDVRRRIGGRGSRSVYVVRTLRVRTLTLRHTARKHSVPTRCPHTECADYN